jgi:hypothetical protein
MESEGGAESVSPSFMEEIVMNVRVPLCLLLASLTAGCTPSESSPNHPIHGVNPDGTPKWVRRGSGVYEGDAGKAFYGVGLAQGIRNLSLLRQTADNRARGEVAKMFDLYVAAMMKDYQRSTTAGDFQNTAEEQDVVSAQKTITEVVLRGVEVRDHWRDPANDAEYALAVLQVEAMMDAIEKANELSTSIREHVRANARRAFQDLNSELSRRSSRR